MLITLMAALMAAGAGYSALLTVDFENGSPGFAPVGASTVKPTSTTTTNEVAVVASSAAGTGKGARFFDNRNDSGCALEYNFVANTASQLSAIKFSFDFAPRADTATSSNGTMNVSVGAWGADGSSGLNSAVSRATEIRLDSNGRLRVLWNGVAKTVSTYANGTRVSFDMYLNDYDSQSVNYTVGSTTYTLPANSVAYWVNGAMVLNGTAEYGSLNLTNILTAGTAISTSENNLGRIGFTSSGTNVGLDFSLDNISVTAIPEPATIGMVMLGALAIFGVRRYRG